MAPSYSTRNSYSISLLAEGYSTRSRNDTKRLFSPTSQPFITVLVWRVSGVSVTLIGFTPLTIFPFSVAHLNLGLVLALLGMKEEAIEVYRKCSQLDGSGLKDPRTHETTKISALFNLGRLYADEGQYAKAIEVYNEAIQRMPPHYQPQSLYNMLGEAYFKLERLREAEHWYREALRVKADHIPAHLTYGKLLTKMVRRVINTVQ